MGLLEWLGLRAAQQPASPWADNSHLTRVTLEQLWDGLGERPTGGLVPAWLSRADAMQVPAVAGVRHRIVGTLSRLPLVATADAGARAGEQWTRALGLLGQPDDLEPHTATMGKTLDDLLFDGRACWATTDAYVDGRPRSIVHVPLWHLTPEGHLSRAFVDWLRQARGQTVLQHPNRPGLPHLILFPGPHAGLLNMQTAIRQAAELQAAAGKAASNPIPSVELHQIAGPPLSAEARRELIEGWAEARAGRNGGVAFTNSSIEAKMHGSADAALMVDGRNQAAVDIARLAGIPASTIDAGIPGASITYANLRERVADLINMGLQPYAASITARLSMDDVLPQNVRARFDYTELYPAETAATAPASTPEPAPAVTGEPQ